MTELLSLSKFSHILRTPCLLVPYLLPECCFPPSTLTAFLSSLALLLQPSPLAPVPLADPSANHSRSRPAAQLQPHLR